MSKAQLDAHLEKLEALEAQQKTLDKEIETIKAIIKKDLGDRETKETGRYIIRFTSYNSNRFDSKRFEQEHPRLYKAFCTVTTARRFSYVAK